MADATPLLDQISSSQASKEVTANAALLAAWPAMMFAKRDSTSSGLTWGYYGGRLSGVSVGNGTLTLTASNTNYIVVHRTTLAVSVATTTTNWDDTTTYGRAYQVTVGTSAPTDWQDVRKANDGTGIFDVASGGLALTPTAVKTSAYTAAAGDFVPVDTTSGAVTITLPNAPADKSVVAIKHVIQGSTNTVSIACAGSDVLNKTGGSTSATLTLLNQGILLQYKATGAIWYVIADDLPLSQLDSRYSAAGSSVITVSATAPVSPSAGNLWWDSTDGNLKIYYDDGTSSQWVDAVVGAVGATGATGATGPAGPAGPAGAGGASSGTCDGRLTLTSGTPVTTSDVTGATSIYWTPFRGNQIGLYNGSTWDVITFAETSIALGTLTSGKNYDVFAYNNSGTLALELSAAWTSDTARADALALQDGIYVKSADDTRRYLGTMRTTSTTTTEDSGGGVTTQIGGKRFLWNCYNRRTRPLKVFDSTVSWTYSNTTTWRQANGVSGNKIEFVQGLAEDAFDASLICTIAPGTTGAGNSQSGIGLDSTTAPGTFVTAVYGGQLQAINVRRQAVVTSPGYHFIAWLERATQSGTTTWYGSGAASNGFQSGLTGEVFA